MVVGKALARVRSEATTLALRNLARVQPGWIPVPDPVIESVMEARRWSAGFRHRAVTVGGFRMPYLEAGQGEPLVLLHGFSDSKDAFVESVRGLTRRHRVLLPDLPGFGQASSPTTHHYTIANQVKHMTGFFDALGLGSLHLGGSSMGGAISAALAAEMPARIRSLTLVAAAGVEMPQPSALVTSLESGINPFVVHSVADYRKFMKFVMEIQPPYPAQVFAYLARQAAARAEMNTKIMDDLLDEGLDLTPRLPQIRCPTLLVWGDRDRLIDPSVGHVYRREVPGARLVTLHRVGHVPHYEVPDELGRVMGQFLRQDARSPLLP